MFQATRVDEMSDPEILDGKAVARLREWGGDKLVAEMVRLFLANSPQRMDQIRSGLQSGDAQQTERGAHSLKSSSANLGAEGVRRIALQIEGAAAEEDLASASTLLPALEEAYSRACAALEAVERGNEETVT